MEIINYSEEHKIFRDSLRKFLDKEVVPHIEEWEEAGIVPRSVWKKMGEQGFLCTGVPEEYGGLAADFLYSVIVTEETTKSGFSGLTASLHSDIVVPYITSFASEEQKHKYLPGCISGDIITAVAMTEPNAGSDLAAMKTTAIEDGDHIVLNGQKTFISNGINCDLIVVAARDPSINDPHTAVDLFLVDATTPGFEKGKADQKDRLAQSGHGGDVLYRLPDSQGKPDGGEGNGILEAHAETSAGKTRLRHRRRGGGRDDGGNDDQVLQRENRLRETSLQIPAYPVRTRRNVNRSKAGADIHGQAHHGPCRR